MLGWQAWPLNGWGMFLQFFRFSTEANERDGRWDRKSAATTTSVSVLTSTNLAWIPVVAFGNGVKQIAMHSQSDVWHHWKKETFDSHFGAGPRTGAGLRQSGTIPQCVGRLPRPVHKWAQRRCTSWGRAATRIEQEGHLVQLVPGTTRRTSKHTIPLPPPTCSWTRIGYLDTSPRRWRRLTHRIHHGCTYRYI